jgi:hypothetical protein
LRGCLNQQVGPAFPPLADPKAPLKYDDILVRLDKGEAMHRAAALYVR